MNGDSEFAVKFWRPATMIVLTVILVVTYIVFPIFKLHSPDLPDGFWHFSEIFVGAYVIGHSAEQVTGLINGNGNGHA